jgi:hypothetical protein
VAEQSLRYLASTERLPQDTLGDQKDCNGGRRPKRKAGKGLKKRGRKKT